MADGFKVTIDQRQNAGGFAALPSANDMQL